MFSLSRSSRARLPIFLLASTLLPIAFSGCFSIKMRELRTEVQMKEARIQQLSQDMNVLSESNAMAQREVANLTRQLAERDAMLIQLRAELGTTSDKLSTTRVALNTSVESTKRELGARLAAALENEQALRQELDELKNRSASLQTEIMKEELEREQVVQALSEARTTLAERTALIERIQTTLAERNQEIANLRISHETALKQAQATHEAELAKARSGNEEAVAAAAAARAEEIRLLEESRGQLERDLTAARERLEGMSSEMRVLNDLSDERSRSAAAFEKQIADLRSQLEAASATAQTASITKSVPSAKVNAALDTAKSRLAPLVQSGVARVDATEEGVRIHLFSDEVFQSGTTLLSDAGLRALQTVDSIVQQIGYEQLIVAGHTDNVPVRNMPYPDNWELAAARASEMVRWLAAQPGSQPSKIFAQSHAYHRPLGDNSTAAGRRLNRRVEVVVVMAAE